MRALAVIAVIVACRPPAPAAPVDRDDDDIPDSDDRCPGEALSPTCLVGGDTDGCPDLPPVEIGPTQVSAASVDAIGRDAQGLAPGVSLYVSGDPPAVRRVSDALIARGVARARLVEQPHTPAAPGWAEVSCR